MGLQRGPQGGFPPPTGDRHRTMDKATRQLVVDVAALVTGVLLITSLPLPNPPSLVLAALQLAGLPLLVVGVWQLVVRSR
jgi:hypothetical protein